MTLVGEGYQLIKRVAVTLLSIERILGWGSTVTHALLNSRGGTRVVQFVSGSMKLPTMRCGYVSYA